MDVCKSAVPDYCICFCIFANLPKRDRSVLSVSDCKHVSMEFLQRRRDAGLGKYTLSGRSGEEGVFSETDIAAGVHNGEFYKYADFLFDNIRYYPGVRLGDRLAAAAISFGHHAD